MLTQDQLKKLGRIYACLYFVEADLFLKDQRVINIRVKKWQPFDSDIFDVDGEIFQCEVEKIDLDIAQASVLCEIKYYEDDVYDDETDELISEGALITDEDKIMNLDQERFMDDEDWRVITDEEIEELYEQANF